MAEIVVYDATGAPHFMSHLAGISDLTWSSGWGNGRPGGCQEASWSIDLPPNANHQALVTGASVAIMDGPVRVWWGRLSEPDRGEPWELHARGMASFAADYLALDATGLPTSVPTTAVAQAIARGLPWTAGTVSSTALASTSVDQNYLHTLLDTWGEVNGQRWGVFADGVLRTAADPTTPTWHLMPSTALMGVADDDYLTHVYARYVTATAGTPPAPSAWATVTAQDTAAAARFGRREVSLDLTNLGVISAGTATSHAAAALAKGSARMGWTTALEVTADELVTPGGIPARLAQVQAGDMVRIFGVLDSQGALVLNGTQDIVIGETRYTDGADSIYLAPVGLAVRNLRDALAAPSPPEPALKG